MITSLHMYLYRVDNDIFSEEMYQSSWLYQSITYLTSTRTPMKTLPSEPIPCMSNLYKLTTKCVTEVAIIGRKRVYWRTILVQKRGSKEYKAKLCSILA